MSAAIEAGNLKEIVEDRIEIVEKLHQDLNGQLVGGGSAFTLVGNIRLLRQFFAWADAELEGISVNEVEQSFIRWTDHLLHRLRTMNEINFETATKAGHTVGSILDRILNRSSPLFKRTMLWKVYYGRSRKAKSEGKQNLERTFEFGRILLDVSNALTTETIFGPIPLKIPFSNGNTYEDWCGFIPPDALKPPSSKFDEDRRTKLRNRWNANTTVANRSAAINFRIQAELLLFIAQTGMNFIQTLTLKDEHFHYTSYMDGYQVRRYKDRRKGEVEFEIYSTYKEVFERYREWRKKIFNDGDNELLFPFILDGSKSDDKLHVLGRIRSICKKQGVQYCSPRALRKTRVNWLIRQVQNSNTTVEMTQHSKQTLLGTYHQPNLQVAISEITRFHKATDPYLIPPGPGQCMTLAPDTITQVAQSAPQPDCVSPSGCLFCKQQRDIDSEDYVWSLATFRHLKTIELSKYNRPLLDDASKNLHPAKLAIERISQKLKAFEELSIDRAAWVKEACTRVFEGDYHAAWSGFISLMEAR
ncbi:MAG: site-specific integrase [Burkholderiaceae bacterium]